MRQEVTFAHLYCNIFNSNAVNLLQDNPTVENLRWGEGRGEGVRRAGEPGNLFVTWHPFWPARIYVNRENSRPKYCHEENVVQRVQSLVCLCTKAYTYSLSAFPASDENTKKLLYVLQMVIFIIILRERLLSWKILLNITIFLYFHHLRGKLTVNIQWICVRFRTETHQTLYSLNHIFLQNWWEGPYDIKCTLMFSLFT